MPVLDLRTAGRFAAIALDNVVREFPHKLDHVMLGAADVTSPRSLHPAFYGSFDWHSCVHMHWLLARLLRTMPGLPQAAAIERLFDGNLGREAIAGEVAYLARAGTQAFERPYGWAWLLKLAQEIGAGDGQRFARWGAGLAPLADAFVVRFLDWLVKARHPLRTGMHGNSAFALGLALDYAQATGERPLALACASAARVWYGQDRDYPAGFEPSGTDFLSPALTEADLMRRVLAPAEFARWLTGFLPGLASREPAALFEPAIPSDRGDGQIVHLDGLNLARAWCFRGVAAALPAEDPRIAVLVGAAAAHVAAGMKGVDSPDYAGAHWLASFALLALGDR